MKLHFDAARVLELLEHSQSADARVPIGSNQDDSPQRNLAAAASVLSGLWLVGEDGVYLMSNAAPLLTEDWATGHVTFAEEADPARHPDTYHDVKKKALGEVDCAIFRNDRWIRIALLYSRANQACLSVTPRYVLPTSPRAARSRVTRRR
jgi:hypothetical protein